MRLRPLIHTAQRFCPDRTHGQTPEQDAAVHQKRPAGNILFRFRFPRQGETDAAQRTMRNAVHAADAALVVDHAFFDVDAAGGTRSYAGPAADAFPEDRKLEHAESRGQSEQSPHRTDRGAVKPFFPRGEHDDENQHDESAERKDRRDAAEIGVRIQQLEPGVPAEQQQTVNDARDPVAELAEIRHPGLFPAGEKNEDVLEQTEWAEHRTIEAAEQNGDQQDPEHHAQRAGGKRGGAFDQCRTELNMQERRKPGGGTRKRQPRQKQKHRRRDQPDIPDPHFFPCRHTINSFRLPQNNL